MILSKDEKKKSPILFYQPSEQRRNKRKMKRLIVLFLTISSYAAGQPGNDTIYLSDLFGMAVRSHPYFQQKELHNQITDVKTSNLSKSWFPSISIEGQATYQSDVIEVDFGQITNQNIPSFSSPHDQYKLYLNLEQKIYDGGITRQQKILENKGHQINQQQIEISFHQLKQQVAMVYFSIILLSKNIELTQLLQHELNEKLNTVEVAVETGASLLSGAQVLRAELLKLDQQIAELKFKKNAQLNILSQLTGLTINSNTYFEWVETALDTFSNERPELQLLNLQKDIAEQAYSLEKSVRRPKAFAFSQAGYGRPGLNMLNTEFDTYYLIGLGFKWKLYDWGELSNKKKLTEYQKNSIDLQKDNLNRNISIAAQNEVSNIENFRSAIRKDEEIIGLRKEIEKAASVQFENGTITATQFLTEANAALQAKILLENHKIMLAQSQINYLLITGDI
jgi:outer membrane protein TolC